MASSVRSLSGYTPGSSRHQKEDTAKKKACLLAIKERLPGVPDDVAERIWRAPKASDGAAEDTRWTLKLTVVGGEALKKYFRVSHDKYDPNDRHGLKRGTPVYFDFLARNLLHQK